MTISAATLIKRVCHVAGCPLPSESIRRRLLKERQEDKQNKKDQPKTTATDDEGPIFPDTYYNDEVLKVGLDYISLLKDQTTAGK